MKVKIRMVLLGLFVFAASAGMATAQDTTKTTHKKTRSLSGCLQKGDEANEYRLTTAKGGTWEIKSDTLKLGDHVGHTVTLTGVVSNAKMHAMKKAPKPTPKKHALDKTSPTPAHST